MYGLWGGIDGSRRGVPGGEDEGSIELEGNAARASYLPMRSECGEDDGHCRARPWRSADICGEESTPPRPTASCILQAQLLDWTSRSGSRTRMSASATIQIATPCHFAKVQRWYSVQLVSNIAYCLFLFLAELDKSGSTFHRYISAITYNTTTTAISAAGQQTPCPDR